MPRQVNILTPGILPARLTACDLPGETGSRAGEVAHAPVPGRGRTP
jgi:hypothetical protein